MPVLGDVKETTMSAHARPSHPPSFLAGDATMLTACAWCERIRLGDRWVDAARAIAHLRTYEWRRPPQFTHGICETCLEVVERRRSAATAAR
jgi:hypothetical protein